MISCTSANSKLINLPREVDPTCHFKGLVKLLSKRRMRVGLGKHISVTVAVERVLLELEI